MGGRAVPAERGARPTVLVHPGGLEPPYPAWSFMWEGPTAERSRASSASRADRQARQCAGYLQLRRLTLSLRRAALPQIGRLAAPEPAS